MGEEFGEDYRRGYNAALHFYEKHDKERSERIADLEAENEKLKEDSYFALYKSAKERVFAVEQERDRLKEDQEHLLAVVAEYRERNDALKKQIARLTAPVTEEDAQKYGGYGVHDDLFDTRGVMDLLAARASKEEKA